MKTFLGFDRLAAVMLVVGVLVTASCSTAQVSPAPTSQAAGKPYGNLTIATGMVGSMDPRLDSGTNYDAVGAAIIDSLWYWNVDHSELMHGIAERWEIASDGMTHTFYIRRGVKFHDGSDLTGADVKFSFERMLAPGSIPPEASAWRSAVARVDLKDDYTVVIRMKTAQYELLVDNNTHVIAAVVPKKYIEEKGDEYFASHPMGSGPWKVVSYEPGRLELEAVENHWRATPKFKNLTVLRVPEEATKVAMLKTGELDMAAVSPDAVAGLRAAGLGIQSYWPGSGYYGYALYDVDNPQKYALGDVRVRKALQLAIDSKELASGLFRGRAEPGITLARDYVDSDSKANTFDPNLLKPDPYDPEQAKKLLVEAGYANGFNTRIYDSLQGSVLSTVDLAVAGYWGKIGVNTQIVPLDYAIFRPRLSQRGPELWNSYWIFLSGGGKSWQKMFNYFHSAQSSPKNLKNPEIDRLLDSVGTTRDSVERDRMKLQAAVLAKNEYTAISVVGTHNTLAFGNKVGDFAKPLYVKEISGRMYETITHAK